MRILPVAPLIFLLQILPNAVAGEQKYRFGMIDDMMNIVGGKVLKDGNNDCSIRDGCHIGDAPVSVVLPITEILSPLRRLQCLNNRCKRAIFQLPPHKYIGYLLHNLCNKVDPNFHGNYFRIV